MDPVITPPPAETPVVPPPAPPIPPATGKRFPVSLKVVLPVLIMVAALPFLARSVLLRQLTGSRAALPNTYCVDTFGCPTPSPLPTTPTPTPAAAAFTNMQANLQATNAWFTFNYSGPTSSLYRVHLSTYADMSWDVYLSFATGTNPPLVQSNPTQWDKYVCGRTLYWRVEASNGTLSQIMPALVCGTLPTPSATPTPSPRPIITPTPTPRPIITVTPTPIVATPTPITLAPLGFWNFNQISDNTCAGGINDACNTGSAGTSIDGAKTNMVTTWSKGVYGNGLSFDGVNDFVNMSSSSKLDLTGKFTIEAWFKFNVNTGTTSQFIASRDYSSGNRGWGMAISSNRLVFEKGGANLMTGPTVMSTGTWYHGAATFDGTTWRLYLNGTLQTSVAGTSILSNPSAQFRVGARQYVGAENYLAGQIDEVRIYNYARSASQIVADKNNQ